MTDGLPIGGWICGEAAFKWSDWIFWRSLCVAFVILGGLVILGLNSIKPVRASSFREVFVSKILSAVARNYIGCGKS